ncbi:PrsW family intramembrane metalloprotease [Natronomonas sp. EA1]|uniref:PrsW family intramembrane metalloprotease n=1 Tax=Natronomonas sp. EA1 TaxID=3421655 RepID=UPI003EBE1038
MPEDPVADASDGEDLYDVAHWEERTALDRLATGVHGALSKGSRGLLVLVATLLLVAQVGVIAYAFTVEPTLGGLAVLSILPALGLVGFVWYQDATMREPVSVLAVTFVLAVLFASFAATVNTVLQPIFKLVPVVGMALFFFVVVAPIEETVKWLAVRVFAFNSDDFDAVIDGAVYGAVAGLGFATIENALYITQAVIENGGLVAAPIERAFATATARAFVGPGHVIYSAFAGYYLGLAKFNREHAGPIVVKGLLIAAFIHATYNTIVTYVPLPGLTFIAFILVYDGLFGYILYRKLKRYREKYQAIGGDAESTSGAETATD